MSICKDKAKASGADLVALGECSLDVVAVGEAPWPVDGKVRLSTLDLMSGGQAATVAVGVVRQGWRAQCIAVVGDDAWGRRVEADLRREGVETRLVIRAGVQTRSAVVLVDARSGHRAVLEHRPAALNLAIEKSEEFDPAAVIGARLLSVDATDLAASRRAAEVARAAGVPVMVDVDWVSPDVAPLLRLADLLIVPEAFALEATNAPSPREALVSLAREYRPIVTVVTLGARGVVACRGAEQYLMPAFPVETVDTTGAGDAFRAGFAAAWLASGGSAPLGEILRWATVTAGLSCRGRGAQAGLPTRASVEAAVGASVTPGGVAGLSDQPPRGR